MNASVEKKERGRRRMNKNASRVHRSCGWVRLNEISDGKRKREESEKYMLLKLQTFTVHFSSSNYSGSYARSKMKLIQFKIEMRRKSKPNKKIKRTRTRGLEKKMKSIFMLYICVNV